MLIKSFDTVWFLPAANTWRNFQLLAYKDIGLLNIYDEFVEFRGRETVAVRDIRSIAYCRQGRDFINKWVKIEYVVSQNPSVAYFADGSMLGWGGIFGGTKKILAALKLYQSRSGRIDYPPDLLAKEGQTERE